MPTVAKKPDQYGYDEKGWPIFGKDEKGIPVCGANKSHGRGMCMSPFRFPNGRCKVHGGMVPIGPTHPNTKHGLYAKTMPGSMQHTFERLLENPDMMSLRADIALQDQRMLTVLEGLNENDTDASHWIKLNELIDNEAPAALASADEDPFVGVLTLSKLLKEIIVLVKTGGNKKKLYKEIAEISLVRTKLTEAELRREEKERDYMPYEQVMILFTNVMLAVRKNVSNPVERRAIAREIDQLSVFPRNRAALGGTPGAAGYLDGKSELAAIVGDEDDMGPTITQQGKVYRLEGDEEVS